MHGITHKVEYFETDQAGVVNNANYYHWMETARIESLAAAGISYEVMEENGFFGITLANSCEYRRAIRLGDTVDVEIVLTDMDDRFFNFKYTISDHESGKDKAYGTSKQCFCGFDGKMISLKDIKPELFEQLKSYIGK